MLPYRQKIVVGDVWLIRDGHSIDGLVIPLDKIIVSKIRQNSSQFAAYINFIDVTGYELTIGEKYFRYLFHQPDIAIA